jgi:hypothetical protein
MSKCATVWRIGTADSNQANSLAGIPQSVPKPIKLAVAGHSSPGDGGLLVSGGPEHLAFRVCGRDHRGVSFPGGGHDPGEGRTFRLALADTFGIVRARVRAVFYKSDKITTCWWKARRRDRERVVRACPLTSARAHGTPPRPPTLRADRTRLDVLLRTRPACHADTLLRLSAPTSPVIAR